MSDHGHHGAPPPRELNAAPFEGGRTLMIGAGAVGVIGLLLTLVGSFSARREALTSYLFGFTYWLGAAVGSLLLLMIWHASAARWPTVLRRVVEGMAASVAIFAVLFIPIVVGMSHLFPWISPDAAALGREGMEKLAHKRPYLNVTFFLVRAVIYFVSWIVISHLLRTWSVRQDAEGTAELTRKQRRLGAGALPLVAFALTFASFDWLMSLDPIFSSTIFGLYYFAGAFVSAIALLIIVLEATNKRGMLSGAVSIEHMHSVGMLLFAFTCFWAYMAYSQYMLTWIANLPHETPFYLRRQQGGWWMVAVALIAGHFVVPFFVLLSRRIKRRAGGLTVMAVWILAWHFVDLYWIIVPPANKVARFHWTIIPAFLGVGGIAVAFAVFRMRGARLLPVGDPYLEQSLRYLQP